MDFIPQAGIEYLGASCECCDASVEMGLAIYVEEEADQQGDGWTYRRRVQCGPCHDFVATAVTEARRAAFVEAAQTARACASTAFAYDCLMGKARIAHQQAQEAAA